MLPARWLRRRCLATLVALLAVLPYAAQGQYLLAQRDAEWCQPEMCTNRTAALELAVASNNTFVNFTALDDYEACVADAQNVTALLCHCTIHIYECLNSPVGGNSASTDRGTTATGGLSIKAWAVHKVFAAPPPPAACCDGGWCLC